MPPFLAFCFPLKPPHRIRSPREYLHNLSYIQYTLTKRYRLTSCWVWSGNQRCLGLGTGLSPRLIDIYVPPVRPATAAQRVTLSPCLTLLSRVSGGVPFYVPQHADTLENSRPPNPHHRRPSHRCISAFSAMADRSDTMGSDQHLENVAKRHPGSCRRKQLVEGR